MTTITLNVPDISCGHCKSSIEGAVAELVGIERSKSRSTTRPSTSPSTTAPSSSGRHRRAPSKTRATTSP